tara:strand:+ start:564 stop:2165 length:1602 start_codon:yes stop_codon:yes gene_type:complete
MLFDMSDVKNKKDKEVTTFSVPLSLGWKIDGINNNFIKLSKNQIISQAFKLHSEGNIQEAEKYYKYFINNGFEDPIVFSNYAIILKHYGKLEEAEVFSQKAIALKPDFADAHYNLANTLSDLGKFKEAEISLRKVIQIEPKYTKAYTNLGNILKDLGELEEAEFLQRKAIEINPSLPELHNNLGIILNDIGKLDEAEISFRNAIKIKPTFENAYFNLSLVELIKGKYKEGLEKFEFRFKKKNPPFLHGNPIIKKIDDIELNKVENLLVISEQGLGDTIQYMRYIPYLRNQGLDVYFSAQEKLHSLIKASGIDSNPLTPEEVNIFSMGKWMPLLSLPRYLNVNPLNPIISEPYIYPTDKQKIKWKNILSKEDKLIIGINWQGNPDFEKTSQRGRSLLLENFSILAKYRKIKLLSLQKGFGSEQLDQCSFKNKFVKCQPQINSTWDFLENAAIIENCDLIITSDTSIAHLAGGMGKLTWLLLKYIPEWRWGLKGDSTFWYQSMRLFRQKERNNWQEVMERVSSALKVEISSKISV